MKASKIVFILISLLIVFGCSSRTEYRASDIIAQLEEKPVSREKSETKRVFKAPPKENYEERGELNFKQLAVNNYNFPSAERISDSDFALIIGIATYDATSNVIYADNSAYAFRELARQTLGIPKENILLLINEQATSGKVKSRIALAKELAEKGGSIYFYYAGHGVPAKDANTYLLPYDMRADEIHLEPNLKMDTIYQTLESSLADSVFVFVDTCFSGKDDGGNLLYEGVAPALIISKGTSSLKKTTLLTAGGPSDFANDYKPKQQRMFTHFLIQAMVDGDRQIGRIFENLRKNVKRASLRKGLGYKQVPQLVGKKQGELY